MLAPQNHYTKKQTKSFGFLLVASVVIERHLFYNKNKQGRGGIKWLNQALNTFTLPRPLKKPYGDWNPRPNPSG
jgi:hypothetical protein